MSSIAYLYHNDLLAPYLALPQSGKIQAECPFVLRYFGPRLTYHASCRCLDRR